MLKKNKQVFVLVFTLLLVTSCNTNNRTIKSFNSYIDSSSGYLVKALSKKKEGLINYLTNIKAICTNVGNDEVLTSFFKAKNDFYQLKKEGIAIPKEFDKSINNLKSKINQHYLNNYIQFYDILFINTQGDIFYTIRKESDYHANIHDSLFINTTFTQRLTTTPQEAFVDFQLYKASGMPSAFFIEPLIENEQCLGWFVLQFSTDKIDHMFNDNENMGKTGEIILVNKNHYLLTNSRFLAQETILKQKLPKQNIDSKFKEKKGIKQVTDYRGKKVISAFEVFSFMHCEWLIIVKKDLTELMNEYYKEYENEIVEKLKTQIETEIKNTKHHSEPFTPKTKASSVFIDEYKRSDSVNYLFTQGVSTCTALCFTYKDNFAYMAHISPYDAIYGQTQTDITKTMANKIDYFEISDCEKERIEISVVFNNLLTMPKIIDKLLEHNYNLNQIKLAYNKQANYANVYCNINNEIWVNWYKQNGTVFSENLAQHKNLHQLVLSLK